jgi:hypothetical protein
MSSRVVAFAAAVASTVGGVRAGSGWLLLAATVLTAWAVWPRKAKDCGGIHCGGCH